jgi:ankyrin repeat protein
VIYVDPNTALFYSIDKSNNIIFDMLLSLKRTILSIDHINGNGNTALMSSIYESNEYMIKKLLKVSNVNITNNKGETALYQACINKEYEVIKNLIDLGSNIDLLNF